MDWTWNQVSFGEQGHVYAIPQDAGPMIQMCNNDLLTAAGITAPTTWDEFAKDVTDYHTKVPNGYFTNMTADQGWYFGLLWQSGAKPFTVGGTNLGSVDLGGNYVGSDRTFTNSTMVMSGLTVVVRSESRESKAPGRQVRHLSTHHFSIRSPMRSH